MMKTSLKFAGALMLAAMCAVAMAAPDVAAHAVQHFVQFAGADNLAALSLMGTTLAANSPRAYELGDRNMLPVAASTKIYEGAAVGIVAGTGHTRPLVAGDGFGGFAVYTADNSAGAAAAINVEVMEEGQIELSVAGAVITDVRQPVYASDDDTFVFSPVGNTFIGFVKRFVSAGIVVVEFDTDAFRDPYGDHTVRLTISVDTTLDATHTGKLLWVDTDAKIITLPAVAAGLDGVMVVNGGAFGTVAVNISPNASDSLFGPDITAADNKDLINTKATAKRGDFAVIGGNDADGLAVQALRGTWAREA
jgi:hypothetical protein